MAFRFVGYGIQVRRLWAFIERARAGAESYIRFKNIIQKLNESYACG